MLEGRLNSALRIPKLVLPACHQNLEPHLGEFFCGAQGFFSRLELAHPDPMIFLRRGLHRGDLDILKIFSQLLC